MKTQVSECVTLGEYRREVLKAPQADIARVARCHPAWISQVECGHLPAPWKRDMLLKAYQLDKQPEEFERLVLAVKRKRALARPMRETEPLMACSERIIKSVIPAEFEDLSDSDRILVQTVATQALAMKRAAESRTA